MGKIRNEIRGIEFREALASATRCLEKHRDAVNALNVFPVPDGDTGTNMLLTMKSGTERMNDTNEATVAQIASWWADGVFWGARGNSGVILSQFFKGFAAGLEEVEACDGSIFGKAFHFATEAAYKSVSSPVEGTILTVIRCMAEAVQEKFDQGQDSASATWETAFRSGLVALESTPLLLPVLQEAGVVDAGGMGMVIIIGAMWCSFCGLDDTTVESELGSISGLKEWAEGSAPLIQEDFLNASGEPEWGYCTQFLIQGKGLLLEQIREDLAMSAESVLVVGDEENVRVHVHILDPGAILSYGVAQGQLRQIKIDNMSLQNTDWSATHRSVAEIKPGISVVAVAPGEGLSELFLDGGCVGVVSGGQTMNPSVRQLIDAVEATGTSDVIILPNNKNILLTAEQAAQSELGGHTIHVISTKTIPQGVAAILAFNAAGSLGDSVQAMAAASESVVTVEVTLAVRNTTVGALNVEEGKYIGLLEGDLVVTADTPEQALIDCLQQVGLTEDKILTLYWGENSSAGQAEEVCHELKMHVPGLQVDVFFGGQPHYPYLASVE